MKCSRFKTLEQILVAKVASLLRDLLARARRHGGSPSKRVRRQHCWDSSVEAVSLRQFRCDSSDDGHAGFASIPGEARKGRLSAIRCHPPPSPADVSQARARDARHRAHVNASMRRLPRARDDASPTSCDANGGSREIGDAPSPGNLESAPRAGPLDYSGIPRTWHLGEQTSFDGQAMS